MADAPIVSYADSCLDVILYRALCHVERGYYVDVGAYRPEDISATKLFYDRGWSGINIEPTKRWFDELVAARARDRNLQVIVADHVGDVEFQASDADCGGDLSTSDPSIAERWRQRGFEFETSRRPCRTLADIIDEYAPGRTLHFLKIDVEGGEESVLRGADFKRHRPWIIAIEAIDPVDRSATFDAWEHLIIGAGYCFGMQYGNNRLYWAAERLELKAALTVPFFEFVEFVGRGEREAQLQLQLDAMRRSTSWRATEPMRAVVTLFRK
jgi:FkbM family methyltransferase